jgi:hypothetical protein
MTQHSDPAPVVAASRRYTDPSAWVGWIAFAGFIMVMLGAFHVIQGLVALFDHTYYAVGRNGLLVSVDYTVWGWVHLVAGVVVIVAGVCVFAGQVWARAIGTLIALVSAVLNIAFLGASPLWSIVMIALDVVVILALTVHGADIKPEQA